MSLPAPPSRPRGAGRRPERAYRRAAPIRSASVAHGRNLPSCAARGARTAAGQCSDVVRHYGARTVRGDYPGPTAASRYRLGLQIGVLAVLLEQYGDVLVVGVTGLRVDLDLLAEHRLAGRDVDPATAEHLVYHALPGSVRLGDRGQDGLHCRHAVQCIVRTGLRAVLLLVGVDQLRSRAAALDQLLGRQTGEAQVHALRLRLSAELGVADETVRCHELDLVVVTQHGDLVLDQLTTVVVVDAAHIDHVRVHRLDVLEDRRVARLLGVPGLVAEDGEAVGLGAVDERRRDALPVGLVVVQDEDPLDLQVLRREVCRGGALVVVRGDHAGVVALAGRVVLVRLARVPLLGQAGVGVRVRDHEHGRRVQHRDLNLRASGVVGAHHGDLVGVRHVRLGVVGAGRLVPLARRCRRVVVGLQLDGVVAGLVVDLIQVELDGTDGVRGRVSRCALHRQVRGNGQRLGAATAATSARATGGPTAATALRTLTSGH